MRKGFTLVETIIVIGIIAVITIITLPAFLGGSHEIDLAGASQDVVASLRQAQNSSAEQLLGSSWGVHLANPTSTAPYYALFTGSSYASGTVKNIYRLPPNVSFVSSTLPVGASVDVVFSPVSGLASVSTTVKLYVVSQPSLSSTIVINASGGGVIAYTPLTPPITYFGKLGLWQRTTSLPTALFYNGLVASNGYLYSIGGQISLAATSTVFNAPINSDGSIGSWQTATSLPYAMYAPDNVIAYGGNIYVIGGTNSGGSTSSVIYTSTNPGGSLGAWQFTSSLPGGLGVLNVVSGNGYFYVFASSGTSTHVMLSAPVNNDGSLGAWQMMGMGSMTTNLEFSAFSGYQANIYFPGGFDFTGAVVTSTVFFAPIGNGGTIGTWQTTTPLRVGVSNHKSIAANGYIYILGGVDASGESTSTVWYGSMNANGTVGVWASTTPLPTPFYNFSATQYNGVIYVAAGRNSTINQTVTSTVLYTRLR